MMKTEKIYQPERAVACYFRTAAAPPNKKILLQITERCNMHCAHCFVSATCAGEEIKYEKIEREMLPALLNASVSKVTLTGGEPLVHPDVVKIINLLSSHNIAVSICTNGGLITDRLLDQLDRSSDIHFNVSLDGFSNNSHGRFRGILKENLFDNIISNIRKLSQRKLLNGILVTPNIYSSIDEYIKICEFATEIHAKYVLFNPLSEFGRGQNTQKLGFPLKKMHELQLATQKFNNENLEIVYIRFPNANKPLGDCVTGKILYVFTNGDIAFCPYMVFAAKDKISKYKPESFIIGNIFEEDCNINKDLELYRLPTDARSSTCESCEIEPYCGKGCLAAKIAQGSLLSDCDVELYPFAKDTGF